MTSETAYRPFVAGLVRELPGHALVDRVAWIHAGRVDAVAEAHDQFLALEHVEHALVGPTCRRIETLDQLHRRLVGAAVQRPAQGSDRAADGRVKVRQRRGDDPRGKGRGVELVFGVQDQRGVKGSAVQFAGRPASWSRCRKCPEIVSSSVAKYRYAYRQRDTGASRAPWTETRPAGGRPRRVAAREVGFGFEVAQHRTARAQHVHGMGIGWNGLQCLLQAGGQGA